MSVRTSKFPKFSSPKLSILVLGSVLAAGALMSAPANAAPRSNDVVFCQAIGLTLEQRPACANDLAGAQGRDARDTVRANWVSRSALAARDLDWGGSLYVPSIDDNALNGTPGTPYQDKPAFVPNTVKAEIHRAMHTDHLDRIQDTSF